MFELQDLFAYILNILMSISSIGLTSIASSCQNSGGRVCKSQGGWLDNESGEKWGEIFKRWWALH